MSRVRPVRLPVALALLPIAAAFAAPQSPVPAKAASPVKTVAAPAAKKAAALSVAVAQPAAALPAVPAVVVEASYLYLDFRCASCIRLERWSAAAIQNGLKDSIEAGRLKWSTRNMETPEGTALADRMGLTTKSLVLMEMRNGRMTRFRNLEGIWQNLRDSAQFADYVQRETIAFLRAAR